MKIKDIANAAQSLADYCYREGESADLMIIQGSLKQTGERLQLLQQDRLEAIAELQPELFREMVTK